MNVKFTTTFDKEMIEELKIDAIKQGVNVNVILGKLIEMYLNGKIKIDFKQN